MQWWWTAFEAASITLPPMSSSAWRVLTQAQWRAELFTHRSRMGALLGGALDRSELGARLRREHPVYNFVFTYYFFSRDALLAWSPGPRVALLGLRDAANAAEHLGRYGALKHHRAAALLPHGARHSLSLPANVPAVHFTAAVAPFSALGALRHARAVLRGASMRRPVLDCFGLHEYAMLYRPRGCVP